MSKESEEKWRLVLRPKRPWYQLGLSELASYRDLLVKWTYREIAVVYKQTILGPLWYVIQPVIQSLTFLVIFGRLAGLSTDGIPMFPFYFASVILWGFFSENFTFTSTTFKDNAEIFGKVYFPRLVMPIAKVLAGYLKLAIQMVLLVGVVVYFHTTGQLVKESYGWELLAVVPLVFMVSMYSLALGLFFSAWTVKYRDLTHLMKFGIQLFMFATPVIYPLSMAPFGLKEWLVYGNPLTSLFEAYRYVIYGVGSFDQQGVLYSCGVIVLSLLLGWIMFQRREQNFADIV